MINRVNLNENSLNRGCLELEAYKQWSYFTKNISSTELKLCIKKIKFGHPFTSCEEKISFISLESPSFTSL